MIHLQVIPDTRLTNDRAEQFARSLCHYQSPLERLTRRTERYFLAFQIVFTGDNITFTFSTPREAKDLVWRAIDTAWPRVTIERTGDPLVGKPTAVSRLELNYHYMFALRVDRRELRLLSALLDTKEMLKEGERISVQVLATPAPPDWYQSAAAAYESFQKGHMPIRIGLDKERLGKFGLKVAAATTYELVSIVSELITGEPAEPVNFSEGERAAILKDGSLRSETRGKVRGDAYDVTIRVAVEAPSPRASALMRMATMAFRELDGDNRLIVKKESVNRGWKLMKERRHGIKITRDYLSIPEVSRLFCLPTAGLQEKYHIRNVDTREIEVPAILLEPSGIPFAEWTMKGRTELVRYPVKGAVDELCLPRVVIGGMGTGKTRGFGANWLTEAVKAEYGGLVIDPAKGEIGDELEAAGISVERFRLGEQTISLDWREVNHSSRARNRLASSMLSFFSDSTDETGLQTSRFIRAIVMSMKTGRMSEMIRILEDEKYREERIQEMPEGIHRTTLEQFHKAKDGRQSQIASPIYNRLDTIMGDVYLSECMDTDEGVDMVEIMSTPGKAVVFDVPQSELGREAVDIVVNLLVTKIDLAMTLRKNLFPFFVLFDEPHQFLRSAKLWKAAAVESRKWRLGYIWMFHSWEQIPRDLREIIRAANPHYHLYKSSPRTFIDLAAEISPFTPEEGIRLKKYHAINVIHTPEGTAPPFVARMLPPPSRR